jgi:hypothetical protein
MVRKITQVEFALVISILVAFAVILSSMVPANIVVYAQEELPNIMTSPKKAPANTTLTASFPSSSVSPPKIHSVKITSPQPGQRVPIGKDLPISGTSMDNANSNNCQVFVIVNSIKPYQPTTPAGAGGANDYSKWNFVISASKYTSIKPGPNNKITSKYACTDSPTTTSYNSVNVTGVGIGTASTMTSAMAAPITTITKKPVSVSNNATIGGYAGSRSSSKMSNPGSHVVSITPPSSAVPAINQVRPVFKSNIMPNLNSSELHVKITSPIEGQGISAGKNFTMSGTSSDNSATDCRVYAGLNRLKPYPPAIAAGPGGSADYSKWYFNYSPAYHTATDGNNRLTAKLSCNDNPGLVKYDTMNITGVTATRTTELPVSSPNTPGSTTKVNQLPSTSDNSQPTSSHDPNKIGSDSSSSDTSNTGSTTSDSTDKSIQTHTKIKIRHDIPIKNSKKSNELANNIIKDVKRHLKEGTSIADSGGAAASAGSASAYAGSDGVSVSAGGITLNLP